VSRKKKAPKVKTFKSGFTLACKELRLILHSSEGERRL
jgi:hypothetical protein